MRRFVVIVDVLLESVLLGVVSEVCYKKVCC